LEVLGASLRMGVTGVDVGGNALLRAPDGVTAQLNFGFQHCYRSTYELWGTRGRISVMRAFTPDEHLRPQVRIEQQDTFTEISLPPDHQVRNTLTAFVQAARSRSDRASFKQSLLEQAMLVDQVRKAAASSMSSTNPV